jgi:hypothetical protein
MKKLLLLLPLAALAGCSLNKTAARVTGGVVDTGLPAVFRQSDPQYVREALPANLQLIEILLASDPGNKGMLINAAQGFCGYAFMFLEDETPERASIFYLKGQGFAERALDGATVETAGKKDAHALFWHTFCKASYMNINRDKPEAIAEIPTLEPAARRLLQLDPAYYYNGAQSILGAYYAIRPRMLGGNPEKAIEHFNLALTGAGEHFLLNRYMLAKMAAVAAQDAELFESQLNAVLSAEPREGETRLADEVAKIKAKKLLEKKDELF